MSKPFSLPTDFITRFNEILPQADIAKAFEPKQFYSFRINTLKTNKEDALAELKKLGVYVEPWAAYPFAVITNENDANVIKSSILVSNGVIYPQSLQSMLPVVVLNPEKGDKILDLCAAPGSKTGQIAMHLAGTGQLTANEPIRDRFYKLKAVMDLIGANVELTMVDGRRFQPRNGLFDKVLVDAPCSSEGRFCLNDPKSVGYWSVRKVHEAAHKQKGLLLNASRLVNPGGVLVYSTCTYAPEENEGVIDWLLRKDPTLSLQTIKLPDVSTYPALLKWQDKDFNPAVAGTMRVFPDAKCEGFFIAKLVKSHYK